MKGKELIFSTFKLEEVERIPWVPFVGVHGAKLIGVNATEYLKSAENIVNGISKAIEKYNPDGIPVVFDLQIEAEVLGCKLEWSDDNPPAVVSHPLAEGKALEDLQLPRKDEGRISVAMEATRLLREKYPDIALYGLITGPFTLALHLLGTDIFMRMLEEPEKITALLEYAKNVANKMTDYFIEAGADIIAVVDPMTSQIDPASFEMFVTPPATEIFEHIRQKGAWGSFFVCGHAQQNIEAMCKCKPDNISIDENIPLDYVKEIALKHNISFGGNMKLTVVLLLGTEEDSQREALECMDLGGKKGFILAPGCDLPMDTPPQNLEAITNMVHDPYQQDVIRALEAKKETEGLLDMHDYGKSDKVVVDIITLDSESCAPCQYMVEAVKNVAPHFEGIVEWREHSVKDVKAVNFMSSLYVKNIPTICIDGKIMFVSQIPPKQKLIEAIQNRINEKLRYKITVHRGELIILSKDKQEYEALDKLVKQAQYELGTDVNVKYITDAEQIKAYGVSSTPALVAVNYDLKTQGALPSADVIKEWIKGII